MFCSSTTFGNYELNIFFKPEGKSYLSILNYGKESLYNSVFVYFPKDMDCRSVRQLLEFKLSMVDMTNSSERKEAEFINKILKQKNLRQLTETYIHMPKFS